MNKAPAAAELSALKRPRDDDDDDARPAKRPKANTPPPAPELVDADDLRERIDGVLADMCAGGMSRYSAFRALAAQIAKATRDKINHVYIGNFTDVSKHEMAHTQHKMRMLSRALDKIEAQNAHGPRPS